MCEYLLTYVWTQQQPLRDKEAIRERTITRLNAGKKGFTGVFTRE